MLPSGLDVLSFRPDADISISRVKKRPSDPSIEEDLSLLFLHHEET